MQKKGAIELSMTTIIVIVLGVTLLILGLAFVRGIFSKVSGLTEEAFSSAEKEIQQRMGATEEMYVSGGLYWEVEPGKPLVRYVGIQNFGDETTASDFKIEVIPGDTKGKKEWFLVPPVGKLEPGDKSGVPIEVTLPKGAPPGTSYPFTIKVLKANTEYSSQSIIVAVKSES